MGLPVHRPEQALAGIHGLRDAQFSHQRLEELGAAYAALVDHLDVAGVQIHERGFVCAPPGGRTLRGQAGCDADRLLRAVTEQDRLVQGLRDGDTDRGHDLLRQREIAVFQRRVANRHESGNLEAVHLGLVEGQVQLVEVRAHLGPDRLRDLAHDVRASLAADAAQRHKLDQLAGRVGFLTHKAQHDFRDRQADARDRPLLADRRAYFRQEAPHLLVAQERLPLLLGEILQSANHRDVSSSVLGAFRTGIPGGFAAAVLAAGRAGRRCGILSRFHAFQLGFQLGDLLLQLIRAFLRFRALLLEGGDLFLNRRALLLGLDLFDGLRQLRLAGLEAFQLLPQRRQLLLLQIDPPPEHQCFKHVSFPPC